MTSHTLSKQFFGQGNLQSSPYQPGSQASSKTFLNHDHGEIETNFKKGQILQYILNVIYSNIEFYHVSLGGHQISAETAKFVRTARLLCL